MLMLATLRSGPRQGGDRDAKMVVAAHAGSEYDACMQYTLRNIPKPLDKALRAKARQEGKSINEAALEAMQRGLGLADEKPVYHDLDWLFGTWVEDPAFDEAIREQHTIHPDDWR